MAKSIENLLTLAEAEEKYVRLGYTRTKFYEMNRNREKLGCAHVFVRPHGPRGVMFIDEVAFNEWLTTDRGEQ